MARPKTTQQKRKRETQRLERAQEKAERRAERKAAPPREAPPGQDPDLVGIVPGPQPIREDIWGEDAVE
jgi:hypothetical protein